MHPARSLVLASSIALGAAACAGLLSVEDVAYAPPGDAGPDVADANLDAGPDGPFCQTKGSGAYFCSDFDEDTFDGSLDAIPTGWNQLTRTNAGNTATLSLDTAFAQSTPNSALFGMGGDLLACAYNRLDKGIDVPPFGAAVLDYDLRVGDATGGTYAVDPAGGAILSDLDVIFPDQKQLTFYVLVGPTNVNVRDQLAAGDGGTLGGGDHAELSPVKVRGTWLHVTIELDLKTSSYTFVFGETRQSEALKSAVPSSAAHVEVKIGPSCMAAKTGPVQVRYDNVTLQLR